VEAPHFGREYSQEIIFSSMDSTLKIRLENLEKRITRWVCDISNIMLVKTISFIVKSISTLHLISPFEMVVLLETLLNPNTILPSFTLQESKRMHAITSLYFSHTNMLFQIVIFEMYLNYFEWLSLKCILNWNVFELFHHWTTKFFLQNSVFFLCIFLIL
jgi:hypothetical protein